MLAFYTVTVYSINVIKEGQRKALKILFYLYRNGIKWEAFKMIKLNNQVAVIVPKKTNDGRSTKSVINKINKLFCLNFGGTSILEVSGYWLDGGRVYHDNNLKIVSNVENIDVETIAEAANLVLTECEQLAVSVEINGSLYIFDANDSIAEELEEIAMEIK